MCNCRVTTIIETMNKTKTFFVQFTILAVLLLTVVSALSFSTQSQDITVGRNTTSFTLTNNNNVVQNVTISVSNIVSGTNRVTLSVDPTLLNNFTIGGTRSLTVKADSFTGNFDFGEYKGTLTATGIDASTGAAVSNVSTPVTFTKSFCKRGTVGDLEITNLDITSSGDEDEEWKPLDEIEVEVEVSNDGSDDLNDVIVEFGLFDSDGKNQAGDLDFSNTDEEEIDFGDLNEGDDERVTFTFKVPADFETGDYKLSIKAYSDDDGEDEQCVDSSSEFDETLYQMIDIQEQDDEGKFIAFDNVEITPTDVTCGDTVTLELEAFNVGEDDEDQVKINLVNSELGLDLSQEIRNNLDKGDSEVLRFTFQVPNTAKEKTYNLELTSEYDYRNGNYRESSDEDTLIGLKVIACGTPSNNNNGNEDALTVSASLASEANAGEELVVRSTIRNAGDSEMTVAVSASDYDSWAELGSQSSRLLTLSPGESSDVTFTFDVAEDASGEQSFVIEARSGNTIETREVAVTLDEARSGTVDLSNLFKGNGLIWVIALINVILIVLIIVVAVRLSRK